MTQHRNAFPEYALRNDVTTEHTALRFPLRVVSTRIMLADFDRTWWVVHNICVRHANALTPPIPMFQYSKKHSKDLVACWKVLRRTSNLKDTKQSQRKAGRASASTHTPRGHVGGVHLVVGWVKTFRGWSQDFNTWTLRWELTRDVTLINEPPPVQKMLPCNVIYGRPLINTFRVVTTAERNIINMTHVFSDL